MNRFALSATIAALAFTTASAAQAADLLVDTPRAPVVYDGPSSSGAWDGFYLGIFGGYAAVIAVFLAIAGFSPRRPELTSTDVDASADASTNDTASAADAATAPNASRDNS